MTEARIQLDHTIVPVRDKRVSATFLAELLGMPDPEPFGPFLAVRLDNDITLDYMDMDDDIAPLHYAFLISESKFDEVFGRIRQRDLAFWADPFKTRPGEINTRDGGRGVYFEEPSGHLLEILTRPYGSGA